MNNDKTYRLWQPVSFSKNWADCDTSLLDDLAPSWFRRRVVLENKSKEYANFLEELKREHAIETAVIERLYDLDKGITETFIKAGFVQSYLSHGDTNISPNDLMRHLNDHLNAVNFVFDVVKENRPLTTGFIKELHHLTTRHQKNAAGRNQFGEKIDIPLLKGTYKVRENNPTRYDGTIIRYDPPEHVAAEMDTLVEIYNELVEKAVHPVIISAWFHHAFTTIHPFQDGNGRVARLLASLIFIKFGYFPITVLREEAKERYIDALSEADEGQPCNLVNYFSEIQRKNIQKALNVREIDDSSLEKVQEAFAKKMQQAEKQPSFDIEKLAQNKADVLNYCEKNTINFKDNLKLKLNGSLQISIKKIDFISNISQKEYTEMIQNFAESNNYRINQNLSNALLIIEFDFKQNQRYNLAFSLHHFGYEKTTLAIAPILVTKNSDNLLTNLHLKIKPHVLSILDFSESQQKNIDLFFEKAYTKALAQIVSEIN